MCGLAGVIGDLYKKDVDAFNLLLHLATTRGRDSAGVAAIGNYTGDVKLVKSLGTAIDLQDHRKYDQVVNTSASVLIGHCRAATVGNITKDNAHPFEFGNVVGAHNGTIPHHVRNSELDPNQLFGTDSEALYFKINTAKRGVLDVLPSLTGAWALSFYDKAERTFNLVRNDQRTLHVFTTKDGKTMFWASEPWMLYAIIEKFGYETTKNGVCYIPPDQLYTWKIPKGIKSLELPTTQEVKGKPAAPFQAYRYDQTGAHLGGGQTPTVGGSTTSETSPKSSSLHGRTETTTDSGTSGKTKQQSSSEPGESTLTEGVNRTLERSTSGHKTSDTNNVVDMRSRVGRPSRKTSLAERIKENKIRKFRPPYHDHTGYKTINKQEFDRRTESGCVMCGAPVSWGEAAIFLNPAHNAGMHAFVCGQCMINDAQQAIELCGFSDNQLKRFV